MNRLAVVPRLTRGFASAAPKTSTGIEHADAMRKMGGGNPDWKLYKADDYLKMNKYSYYNAEITMFNDRVPQPSNKKPDVLPKTKYMSLSATVLKELESADADTIISTITAFNERNATTSDFTNLDFFDRKELVAFVLRESSESRRSPRTAVPILNAYRLICRDSRQVEVLFSDPAIGQYIVHWAFPDNLDLKAATPETLTVLLEGVKCLINALYNSETMRSQFGDVEHESLRSLLDKLCKFPSTDPMIYIPYHLLLRLIFITTALQTEKRVLWLSETFYNVLVNVLEQSVAAAVANESRHSQDYLERANEVLKILFNLYCKAETPDESRARLLMGMMNGLLHTSCSCEAELVQNCINLLAPLPVLPDELCPALDKEQKEVVSEQFDSRNMTLIDLFLDNMEKKMDQEDTDMLGTYLTVLIQYCVACKEVRRYVRLRVLPPLRDVDVSRRPDEGDTARNKLVRVMMGVSRSNVLASELMFVLCKRSVGRMIKYTGLGHSAGLLANSGLLGEINSMKSDENSEDSDTEEYQEVEPRVNPVTGCIRPPEGPSPFEGMSEDQKEVEAMRLVDAMHKLMDAGFIKPGTVGEDGKPRAVKHILELTKDVPDEEKGSDSD